VTAEYYQVRGNVSRKNRRIKIEPIKSSFSVLTGVKWRQFGIEIHWFPFEMLNQGAKIEKRHYRKKPMMLL